MTDTKTKRLHALFNERLTDGDDVPALVDHVLPFIPHGDIAEWARTGVTTAARQWAKSGGLMVNHAARAEDSKAAPVKPWVQFELEEVVVWIKYRAQQRADDYDAETAALVAWCEAHPDADMTPETLRELAA